MLALKATGVHSRPLPDFLADRMLAGFSTSGAVVGKHSECLLYNNATDGSLLRLYGFNIYSGSVSQVNLETLFGTFGSPTGNAGQVRFDRGLGPGVLYSGNSATCIGATLNIYVVQVNIEYGLMSEFPLAIVPPGYSVVLENTATNATLNATFWWVPSKF